MDLIYLVLMLVLFVLTVGLVGAFDRL